jgi:hypothetical protein
VPIVDPDLRVLHDASWLPSNLRHLTFENVTRNGLEYAVGLVYQRNTNVEKTDETIVQAFTSMALGVLPPNLEIRININEHRTIYEVHSQELKGRTFRFLRSVADALESHGIQLEVWHACGRYEEGYKLAITPGYTAQMTCTKPKP